MPKIIKKYGKITLVLGLILVIMGMYLVTPISQAADATKEKDTLSDSRPTVLADHDIKFKIDASTTIEDTEDVDIQFNGFTSGSSATVIGDWSVLHDADGSGAYTALTPTTDWTFTDPGTGISDPSYTFTFTSAGETAIGTDKYIQITLTNDTDKLANPAAGTYKVDIEGDFGDFGVTYVAIISGVSVTATVAESLTFTMDETILDFGTITTGAIRYTTGGASSGGASSEAGAGEPAQLTIGSNASNGLSTTIRSIGDTSNPGLYSTAQTNLIAAAAPSAIAGGTEGYAAYGKNASGVTIVAGFQDAGGTALTISAQEIFTITGAGSGTVDLSTKAGITTTTEAASDYADTLILVTTPTY